jgi:hypothetical protein
MFEQPIPTLPTTPNDLLHHAVWKLESSVLLFGLLASVQNTQALAAAPANIPGAQVMRKVRKTSALL